MENFTRDQKVRIGKSLKVWNIDWVDPNGKWLDLSYTDIARPKSYVLSRRVPIGGTVKIITVDPVAEAWANSN